MIIFTDKARRDYLCAHERYDVGLERRTEAVLKMLAANPNLGWPDEEERDERRLHLTKYPYIIYYKQDGDNLVVIAFRHARAAPQK